MKSNVRNLVRTSLLLAAAIVFQVIGKNVPEINQFFVGPVINAILILLACMCGAFWGVCAGVLTPVLALLVGQLSAPLAPFIPFIMIGNSLFVLGFALLNKHKNWGKYTGVIIGAVVKFAFLSVAAAKLVALFNLGIPPKVAEKLAVSMGTPQLITALAGGFLALLLYRLLKTKGLD
jgi:hypothetical protein